MNPASPTNIACSSRVVAWDHLLSTLQFSSYSSLLLSSFCALDGFHVIPFRMLPKLYVSYRPPAHPLCPSSFSPALALIFLVMRSRPPALALVSLLVRSGAPALVPPRHAVMVTLPPTLPTSRRFALAHRGPQSRQSYSIVGRLGLWLFTTSDT